MGVSTSRPLRNRPKWSGKLHKSVEEVYECDFSRSSISIEGGEGRGKGGGGEGRGKGGGGRGFSFQDQIWPKPSRGRSQSVHDIYLQTAKSDQAPVYASIPSDDTTNPIYANVDKRIVDVTSGTAANESNQVTGDDGSCLKGDKTRFQPTDVNDCTFGCPEPNLQKRSSLSSIYVKLPPVPECLDAEKEKLCGRQCQKTGIVADKGMSYMTAQCIEKSDPLLDSHECTLVNELFIDPSMVAKHSETTGKAGSESDEVEIQENESSSELSIPKVTMQSDDAVRHKEEEEMTGHGSVITGPGCDATARDLLIQGTKLSVCEYELVPDNYGLRRDASYKSGKLFLNEKSRSIVWTVCGVAWKPLPYSG